MRDSSSKKSDNLNDTAKESAIPFVNNSGLSPNQMKLTPLIGDDGGAAAGELENELDVFLKDKMGVDRKSDELKLVNDLNSKSLILNTSL